MCKTVQPKLETPSVSDVGRGMLSFHIFVLWPQFNALSIALEVLILGVVASLLQGLNSNHAAFVSEVHSN